MGNDRSWPHLVSADEISNWSRRIDSFSAFPRIVRMLINRNNDQITRLDMRDAEGVRLPGYDGIVEAQRGTTLVPSGLSVWEMGVNGDFKDKAARDLAKRSANPLGVDPSNTTFVFVTPHRWSGKEDWERKHKESGPWKAVRVLDVDNLMQGLEEARAVHVRLSEMLGKPAASVRSIEDWWRTFSTKTSPAVSVRMVLSGRADSGALLLALLEESRFLTTIRARSIDDVLAFVAATMLTTRPEVRADLLGRTLVVHDVSALRQLEGSEDLLILLPYDEQMRREAELVRANHVLLMCEDDVPADVELPDIAISEVIELLVSDGVDRTLAGELARAAGVSVRKFQRVASQQKVLRPEWSTAFSSREMRRAWLLRSWTASRSGDIEVLEAQLGKPFDEVEDQLRQATRGADPIFSKVGQAWSVVSPADFLGYVLPQLTQSDLDVFERSVQTVLGAVDPTLELPPEERWLAGVRGVARIHSRELRRGVATTLALLGTVGEGAQLPNTLTGGAWVSAILRGLLARANADQSGELWASLTDVLPLLAEASPDVFLSGVDTALAHADTALSAMFVDSGSDALTSSSPHTGLLWALEVTAWFPETFMESVEALARLAALDPGGRLSNRPFNSLVDILRLWLPQTLASGSVRLNAVSALADRHPETGLPLLIGLLPSGHDSAMSNAKPKFRGGGVQPSRVDAREWVETTTALVSELLPRLGTHPDLWASFLKKLDDLPEADRQRVYDELADQIHRMTGPERQAIWEEATALARRHREFRDAEWALPEEEVVRLEEAVSAAAPYDAPDRAKWLFVNSHPDIGIRKGQNYEEYEQELERLRIAAVATILESGGLPALEAFAQSVELPHLVGWALAGVSQ